MAYSFVEHTADAEFTAESDTIEGLFIESARAMYSLIIDSSKINCNIEKKFAVKARDSAGLLRDFLDELLYLLEDKKMVFSEFSLEFHGDSMECTCKGEKYVPERHGQGSNVKAVTYHNLKVWKNGGKWRARVVLDL